MKSLGCGVPICACMRGVYYRPGKETPEWSRQNSSADLEIDCIPTSQSRKPSYHNILGTGWISFKS